MANTTKWLHKATFQKSVSDNAWFPRCIIFFLNAQWSRPYVLGTCEVILFQYLLQFINIQSKSYFTVLVILTLFGSPIFFQPNWARKRNIPNIYRLNICIPNFGDQMAKKEHKHGPTPRDRYTEAKSSPDFLCMYDLQELCVSTDLSLTSW